MSSTEKTEKPKPENSEAAKKKPEPEKKKAPTKAQAEKWTSSINPLLSDPDGVEAFRAFLLNLESEGDKGKFTRCLDFYMECERYKAKFKELEDTAKQIFDDYLEDAAQLPILLQVGADKEVGTDGKGVDIGDKLEEEGLEGVTLFDEAQEMVKKKLADGVYLNFCQDFKKKLKL